MIAHIKRELEEELGYVGGDIFQIGISYPNPASHTNKLYSFIAVGGSCKIAQTLEKGESLEVMKLPLKDLVTMIEDGRSNVIYQSLHLATILFALNFIKNSDVPSVQKLKELL